MKILVRIRSKGEINAENWELMRKAYTNRGWSADESEQEIYANMHLRVKDVEPMRMRDIWLEMDMAQSNHRTWEEEDIGIRRDEDPDKERIDYLGNAGEKGESKSRRSNKGELWLANTGANCHCTYKDDKMINFYQSGTKTISMANNTERDITKKGDLGVKMLKSD